MSERLEELANFERSVGWEIVKKHIEERRQTCVNELLTLGDVDKIRLRQAWAQACEYVLKLPRQLIEEEKNARKQDG